MVMSEFFGGGSFGLVGVHLMEVHLMGVHLAETAHTIESFESDNKLLGSRLTI